MQRAFILATALALAIPAAAADLQPGKYRIAAMVNGEKDDNPEDQCITQQDIDSGLSRMGVERDNGDCKVSDFKRSPGRISYRSTCAEGHSSEAIGKLGGDSFEITMKVNIKGQPPMNMVLVGKRIGACSKS